MIPIGELARAICLRRSVPRELVIFSLHCDASWDGTSGVRGVPHVAKTYVFAGFFADDITCSEIEREWSAVNRKYQVPRFHAAHLNGLTHEYKGWDQSAKVSYSAELLNVLKTQGKRVHAISCGMHADDYARIISPSGRDKMGEPYLACFNSCITLVAQSMNAPGAFGAQDCFSVILDSDYGYQQAIESFFALKANPLFRHRSRLGSCAVASMEDVLCLQVADLIAYEVFKRLHASRNSVADPRYPLRTLMRENVVDERYFGANTFESLKTLIEQAADVPYGRLVVIPEP